MLFIWIHLKITINEKKKKGKNSLQRDSMRYMLSPNKSTNFHIAFKIL